MDFESKKENFMAFRDRAIDFEEGEGFHLNVPDSKNMRIFYNKKSFVIFKIIKVEEVNTCFVYYMYGHDLKSFKNCFYAMINFCMGMNVKFIYYSEKMKEQGFYRKFLREKGFETERKGKKYKHVDFTCKKCGKDGEHCKCKTVNMYI